MHPWRAIQLPRRDVDGRHPRQQRGVGLRMGRWRAVTPSIITGRGDAEHARHGGNRERGLVRAHEPEDPDDTAPVSRANQAAAFESMSRSSRSWRTSRRSLINSSRSARVRVSTKAGQSHIAGSPAHERTTSLRGIGQRPAGAWSGRGQLGGCRRSSRHRSRWPLGATDRAPLWVATRRAAAAGRPP